MNKTVSVVEAKNQFSDLLNRVIYRRERVIVNKRGKPVGAIVSAQDLHRLEEIENARDLALVRQLKKSRKKFVPLARVIENYEKKWGVVVGAKEE
ncbi:MAG: type II toxin-antitoxin system Phd/YefM family antitoxin [Chloroflexi bacterium]|nr:type II toxin-antitoxin system Phd/YefM family antitoxin [Chloroflexota bacterium]